MHILLLLIFIVSAPTVKDAGTFNIPISADAPAIAFQFGVSFDPSVIQPTGCTSPVLLANCNEWPVGTYLVSAYGAYPASGNILNITAHTTGAPTDVSPLAFSGVRFWDNSGEISVLGSDGSVTVRGKR